MYGLAHVCYRHNDWLVLDTGDPDGFAISDDANPGDPWVFVDTDTDFRALNRERTNNGYPPIPLHVQQAAQRAVFGEL